MSQIIVAYEVAGHQIYNFQLNDQLRNAVKDSLARNGIDLNMINDWSNSFSYNGMSRTTTFQVIAHLTDIPDYISETALASSIKRCSKMTVNVIFENSLNN